jgi:hypothetical protein
MRIWDFSRYVLSSGVGAAWLGALGSLRRYITPAIILITAVLSPSHAMAQAAPPTNLLDAALGSVLTSPQVTKVVVERVDPWIARVISPSPSALTNGQAHGDAQATFTDLPGIGSVISTLRKAKIAEEGCYGAAFNAQTLPVSWAVFLYNDDSRIASIYLTRNELCASTGVHMYDVDPFALGIYLERAFSFMNF